jgi:hypothetical protein
VIQSCNNCSGGHSPGASPGREGERKGRSDMGMEGVANRKSALGGKCAPFVTELILFRVSTN